MTGPERDAPDDEPAGSGRARSEQEAWAQIVANFGERAVLEPEATVDEDPWPTTPADDAPPAAPPVPDVVVPDADAHPDRDEVSEREERLEREDRFVPPPLEPLPRTTPLRTAAWAGVLGVPLGVLLVVLLPFDLPRIVFGVMVGWFVASFMYLVATMTRTPRDPYDDGSRV